MAFSRLVRIITTGTVLLACTQALSAAQVDMKRLLNADKEAGQWMSHSRNFDEH
jgi:quinohemoprotein ethanol dehydrogenase